MYISTCIIMIVHDLQKKTVYYEHFKNMFETFVLILDKVEHYTPNCNNVVLEKWQKEKAK